MDRMEGEFVLVYIARFYFVYGYCGSRWFWVIHL